MVRVILVVSIAFCTQALPQRAHPTQHAGEPLVEALLPDAPSPQSSKDAPQDQAPTPSSAPQGTRRSYGPLPPLLTTDPLTPHARFTIYVHQTFGPPSVVLPAVAAGIRMANPPNHYPREWKDGAGAFGRLYGNAIAMQTTQRTTKFLTEITFREDPRYLPAGPGTNLGVRVFHALAFTFFDRSDSGNRRPAFSNFTSAAASGFVGMAYLPDGFNDATHAEQRAAIQFGGLVGANIAKEFAPELAPLVRKIHLPQLLPPWWVINHSQQGMPHP